MNGFIMKGIFSPGFLRATAASLCLGAGFGSLIGCSAYRSVVDPCWPERYNYQARHTVLDTFATQARNGHVLDQTMWNHYFDPIQKEKSNVWEPGDKLNPAGQEHLKYLVRRQPHPDPKLFLQTAQDVGAVPADKVAQARAELDGKRIVAIRNYLAIVTATRENPVEFDIVVRDMATPSLISIPIVGKQAQPTGAVPDNFNSFKGTISGEQTPSASSGGR